MLKGITGGISEVIPSAEKLSEKTLRGITEGVFEDSERNHFHDTLGIPEGIKIKIKINKKNPRDICRNPRMNPKRDTRKHHQTNCRRNGHARHRHPTKIHSVRRIKRAFRGGTQCGL